MLIFKNEANFFHLISLELPQKSVIFLQNRALSSPGLPALSYKSPEWSKRAEYASFYLFLLSWLSRHQLAIQTSILLEFTFTDINTSEDEGPIHRLSKPLGTVFASMRFSRPSKMSVGCQVILLKFHCSQTENSCSRLFWPGPQERSREISRGIEFRDELPGPLLDESARIHLDHIFG